MKLTVVIVSILLLLSPSLHADSLEKRHQVGLKLGMWNQTTGVKTEINTYGVSTSVDAGGFLGGVYYGHWLEEYLALTIDISGMAARITSKAGIPGTSTETSVIGSILMGVNRTRYRLGDLLRKVRGDFVSLLSRRMVHLPPMQARLMTRPIRSACSNPFVLIPIIRARDPLSR